MQVRKKVKMKIVDEKAFAKAKASLLNEDEINGMSMLFSMLADGTRLKIMSALFISEMCVGDLAMLLNMTTSAISHQLSSLKKTKLVRTRKEGKNVFYSMDDEHIENIFKVTYLHVREDHD
jgi:hypothetical protein